MVIPCKKLTDITCPSMEIQVTICEVLMVAVEKSDYGRHRACLLAFINEPRISISNIKHNPKALLCSLDMILLCILLFVSISVFLYRRRSLPGTNWPVIGIAPDLILNAYRINDFATDLVKQGNGTFMLKGPWFANMDMLVTSDPTNINYVLSKNFPNYPKGPEFRKIFDILGDGIFNSDHEVWEIQRKTIMSLLKHPDFNSHLEKNIRNKIEKGLLPVLDLVSHNQQAIDLQEIFQRFTFDTICSLLVDFDPESMSVHLPYNACEKAFTDAEEALLWRHVLPEKVWKLQQRLGMGKEKKLTEARKVFDEFLDKCLSRKEEGFGNDGRVEKEETTTGLLKSLMTSFQGQTGTSGDSRRYLKDTILNLMIAGKDTTSAGLSWFLYLVAQNPRIESKIRREIEKEVGDANWKSLGVKELSGMVYLHGGLCEALRLYPPVALQHKSPSEVDVLPSGHAVNEHSKIILSFYSMGRMESIWGKDCMEFKPERWFTEGGKGGVRHEPSYKFTAFNAGPRTCVGKEMGFIQMKMVASAIIYHYHVELVQRHEVCVGDSIIVHMKHGLKVRLSPVN
ncbi:alkane hydroxylase MAH1 [Lactuca sativa]|uniref:alkane hydroxylase MAH1 n=1 Tax=Lactuca sativa TaxID=4236 RepID=UPI000CD93A9E|nr:alkane hydroxylase MAH1 [Lactuca sativa]